MMTETPKFIHRIDADDSITFLNREWLEFAVANDAPHLTEGWVSRRGEIRLIALPGGRTRLQGTTWYEMHMAPQLYWGLWSDAFIHGIHRRVLEHVGRLAETD